MTLDHKANFEFTREVGGIIFDLDGVLVDSMPAVNRAWQWWAQQHGLDAADVARTIHGMRATEAVAHYLPRADIAAECVRIVEHEQSLSELMATVPGVKALLTALPPQRWAIATSGGRTSAQARLERAGLPIPEVFVTAESVAHGKPHPEPYQLAAARLGLSPADCLVFEDAPAGVAAANAAGATVIGILTSFARSALATPYVMHDFTSVRVGFTGERLFLKCRLDSASEQI